MNDDNRNATTKEPVTVGGWYEHTDGTVGEYHWRDGFAQLVRTVSGWAEVPARTDEQGRLV